MRPRTGWRLMVGLIPLLAIVVVTADGWRGEPAFVSFGERLRASAPVLPVDPPADLQDVRSMDPADGRIEITTFTSTNRPWVTVCTGEPSACETAAFTREVLRREHIGGHDVTIGVPSGSYAVGLGPDLLTYWKSVPLTTRPPAWLDQPSMHAAD